MWESRYESVRKNLEDKNFEIMKLNELADTQFKKKWQSESKIISERFSSERKNMESELNNIKLQKTVQEKQLDFF